MEQQLITWEEWCNGGDDEYSFGGVTTVVPLGNIPVGEKFYSAFVSFGENAYMELYKNKSDDKPTHKFSLRLVAVEE